MEGVIGNGEFGAFLRVRRRRKTRGCCTLTRG